ncbi:hypothetical protein [Sulfitobacter alexandrii]|uniref:hypothetical protein n=1 Tax=Sulfitobacter alexandrii TaxID=1917485 RepID=UPI001C12B452|nr:hypothetical protein [Sulfitobacter alexandrii]
MTPSDIILLSIPPLVIALIVWARVRASRRKSLLPPPVHAPHSPDPGYDRTEMARSAMQGHAEGGTSR